MSRYYRLLLDDYSAASFTSFSKDYYGTLAQIGTLFEAIKQDEELAERQKYILGIYDRYLAGETKISHNVAYQEVPFLIPAKVLGTETTVLTDFSWEHINTWGFPYLVKCDNWFKYAGFDEYIYGSVIVSFLRAAEKYSGYDITEIKAQIEDKRLWFKAHYPEDYALEVLGDKPYFDASEVEEWK